MKIRLLDEKNIEKLPPNTALCLGYFDGVHKGHLELINKAKELNENVAVMTFDKSPSIYFNKHLDGTEIMSLDDKIFYLESIGVKEFIFIRFNQDFADKNKDEFIEEYLRKLSPTTIIVGDDYRFGKKAEGNPKYLANYFDVKTIPLSYFNNKKIGSFEIKELIKNGDIKTANKLLGHNYQIYGSVVEGKHNGRTINFPTANIETNFHYVIPKEGVYSGYLIVDDTRYKSIISIGNHPTIDALKENIIEVHAIEADLDLYYRDVKVEFIDYMRPISKFKDMEELKKQLQYDSGVAKRALK